MNSRILALLPAVFLSVGAGEPATNAPRQSDVRVRHAEIEVTLDPATVSFRSRAALTVEGKGIDRIVFEVGEALAVETSRASDGIVEHRKRGRQLIVDLDPPLDGTRTLTFSLSGTPRRGEESTIRADRAVLGPEDGWVPLHPGFWATVDLTVHAPEGWTAIGPGRAARPQRSGTWRWSTDRPVRTVAFAAAPGLEIREATRGPLTVRVASPAAGPGADEVAGRIFPSIARHSEAFAPYPFDGFNAVFLPGLDRRTRGSGIAVVPAALPLITDSDGAELASGQWFGELVGGDGAWIESWAAWEPVAFARDRALPLPAETVRQRDAYFRLLSGDVALAKAEADAPEAVLRGKGSAAPEMVRLVIGDRPFAAAARAVFAEPAGPRRSLAEFREAFAREAPNRAGPAFDDWFGKPGAPEITATVRTLRTTDDQWRTDVALVQARGLYTLPVEIALHGEDGSEKRETVDIENDKTPLVYVLPFRTLRVEVDPLDRIFRWR